MTELIAKLEALKGKIAFYDNGVDDCIKVVGRCNKGGNMTDLIKQLNALKVDNDSSGLKQNATIDLCVGLVEDYARTNYSESNYPLKERKCENEF